MVTIDRSCEMLATVDRVWEIVSETDKDEEYWGALRDVKVLKKDGNTVQREATVGPRAFARKSLQTLVLDPKKSIELTMSGEGMSGERKIVLVPMDESNTRVDVSWKLSVEGVPGFVQNIVKGQISKATEEALKKIKEEAERAHRARGRHSGGLS